MCVTSHDLYFRSKPEVPRNSKVLKVMKMLSMMLVSGKSVHLKKIPMTSQYTRAPSSGRLKTVQNGLFEDVCGEVLCNHFKIYTHVDCQAAIICVKFQINDVIGGHVTRH